MKSHYSIVFHPLAEKEYLESVAWYEDNRTGLSLGFINEVEKVLDHIETNPFLFPIKKLQLREAPAKTFPYLIIYKINQKQQQVTVLSVFHTKRNQKMKLKK